MGPKRSRSRIHVKAPVGSSSFFLGVSLLALSTGFYPTTPVFAGATTSAYSEQDLLAQEKADDSKIRELREQEVTQLRIALGRRSPTNRRADLYLRLAEIYMEAYRSEFMLEGRVHEKRLDQGMKDTYIDRVHSREFLQAGIKACREILSFNIQYDKLDQVYYFLAFNYGELGDRKTSLQYFDMLTRDYPSSPMVAEAYRQLADSAYDARDYSHAIGYYELAIKKSTPETLPSILHKLSWSYYRTRQYDRAVDTMKQAISTSAQGGERFLNLHEEALRDMAVFMTENGRTDDAIAYFQSVAGDKQFYPKLLEKLGREYERNVEPAKATQVYESLLRTHPDGDVAYRVRVKLIDLDLRRAHFKEAIERIQAMPDFKGSDDTETQVAAQNLRAMVRRTATESHEAYRKKGERPSLETAEAFYEAYLNQFLTKSDPRNETAEIRMYLAEVKRDLGKAQEASRLYRAVVDSRDSRYAKEAGALWTASLADAIHKQSGNKQGSSEKGVKPGEPSDLEKEFVAAADRLTDALGDTNEGREAAIKSSQVEAGYKETQKSATKRISALIKRSPKSPQALTGARLWIQIYADQLADTPEVAKDLRTTISDVRANPELLSYDLENGGKLKALIADEEIRLKVTDIATSEKDKDYTAAAKGYESFANDSNQKDLAEKAFANSIANYIKAGDPDAVYRVTAAWMKRYPTSQKAVDSVRGSATQFLILGSFDAAAAGFEKAGTTGQDPASLQTAARIYQGIGNLEQAQKSWETFLEKYSKSPDRAQVALLLAKSYDAQRDDAKAVKNYRICMESSNYEAECGARLGDLYLKGENFDQAKAVYKQVAAQGPHTDASSKTKSSRKHKAAVEYSAEGLSPFVGYARFKLAESLEKESHFDPLQLPEAQLKKSLEQRTSFLEPLSKAYMSAVEVGGPWAVSALDALANWGMKFAEEVDQIAPPPNASPEAIAKFKTQLKGLSEPLRRKALATWSEGYAKASSSEVLSPAVPSIVDELADASFGNVKRAQGYRGKFRLAGIPSDGGADGREGAWKKTRDKLSKNAQDISAWVDYGNLLWGNGKPLLAELAYEYSLSLNSKANPSAMNNRGVLKLATDGEEDWFFSWQASEFFREALNRDEFFLPSKVNLATLLNYYRLFAQAKPYWTQVRSKVQSSSDVEDGYAISLQGTGDLSGAESSFARATELGAKKTRFANVFHEAIRQIADGTNSSQGSLAAGQCLDKINELGEGSISGFEKTAVAHLKRVCTEWKQAPELKTDSK
jgi:tetratricopeptide (TPR) repeat protein